MINQDPQSTADFWDAYISAADADGLGDAYLDDKR